MNTRDHVPVTIDRFMGLWARGDVDNTPLDHFQDVNNCKSIGDSSFGSRDGIGISQDASAPLSNVKRVYNYPTFTGNTLIILIVDNGDGKIYHQVNETTLYGPILTITGMTDFAFIPYAGRGYISPFTSFDQGDLHIEKGLENEFLYVYAGDGTDARKAAGDPLSGALTIANGAAGHTDAGLKIFGFVLETDSGFLSQPGQLKTFTTSSGNSVSFTNVDTSGDPHVVARHLVASKTINNFNGDLEGYDLFFVPNATIDNDTDIFLNNISFYDADLLEDASHLFDNYAEIPAGAVLSIYHGRLVLASTFNDGNLTIVSAVGEPEAISQIDGILAVQPDSNPVTNVQELRDIVYVFKRSRTVAFTDNGDEPATWLPTIIDTALGTSVHGVATVLDSGGSSVDFLIVATYQGISLFNGLYITPELSFSIESYWKSLDQNEFRKIQIVNAPIQKEIYIITPSQIILCGNYSLGMDPKNMRWWPWSYIMTPNTVAIVNINEIIIGADFGS